jgi:3-hydroxy-9,10-secoandrosta-1,3,5(10)-triene-9,17-dione monooxygenase
MPDDITPPEPDLTPEMMLERAIAMRPILRERQAECESLGRLPESTNQEFVAAGFYRTLQPRRFGGYEFDVPTFVEVMTEVARGCPSSGWVLALTSGHPHTMSYLTERAQVEAYGATGEFRAPLVAAPGVIGQPADGGFLINGGWDYSSGCDIATHFIGHILVPPATPGSLPDILIAQIERADFTIVDNWDVMGMRGTGSRRVVVKDVFVPDHRTAPSPVFSENYLPSIHPNPMYRGRPTSLLMMELACVSVGIALAALDEYEQVLRTKRVLGPISPFRFETPEFQRNFGRAAALIETARAALRQIARDYMAITARAAAGGDAFSAYDDRRLLLVDQQCASLCYEAITLIFQTSGSSAGKADGRLQRYMRDMSFITTHLGLQPDNPQKAFAQLHFGLPLTNPF